MNGHMPIEANHHTYAHNQYSANYNHYKVLYDLLFWRIIFSSYDGKNLLSVFDTLVSFFDDNAGHIRGINTEIKCNFQRYKKPVICGIQSSLKMIKKKSFVFHLRFIFGTKNIYKRIVETIIRN